MIVVILFRNIMLRLPEKDVETKVSPTATSRYSFITVTFFLDFYCTVLYTPSYE